MNQLNTITELRWHDIRHELNTVNPKLTSIIDELNPNHKYTLFKATYSFGSEIIKEGKLFIPNENGTLVPLYSNNISTAIQEKLGYNLGTNPVSIILGNTAEIFMIFEQHTIPLYGLIPEGKIFSSWRVLSQKISHSPAFLWNMTAGARSIFLLSKISESIGHKRLMKTFNIKAEKPVNLLDHWYTLKAIANDENFKDPWKLTIIYFSKKWFEKLNDPAWQRFEHYMLKGSLG